MIALDHNATTPIDPHVLEAMRPFWDLGGNPESRHGLGRRARRAWDASIESVAEILNARPIEVVFTSGGTESNRLALAGLAAARPAGAVVATKLEHPAVSRPLVELGRTVAWVAVEADGVADLDSMQASLTGASFSTLMLAQNETGALQPVAELARLARDRGVPVHTDAVQAVGRIPVDFRALGVATLAASAHKFHGPPGVGILLVRQGTALFDRAPIGQLQGELRPGTPPVPLAVGLAEALRRWQADRDARIARWIELRDRLEAGILAALGPEQVVRQGAMDRLPQTSHLGFVGLDGNALLMQLDLAGVAASLGSACASGSNQPSPALLAMGLPADRLRSSVRFSLGSATTAAEIDEAIGRVVAVVQRLGDADPA